MMRVLKLESLNWECGDLRTPVAVQAVAGLASFEQIMAMS